MLEITTVPNPILRQVSQPVKIIDKKILKFISGLETALIKKTNPPGVGLSAIQVSKPIRIFITYLPTDLSIPMRQWSTKNLHTSAYINPEIVAHSDKLTLGGSRTKPSLEGCLSIPNIWGPVWRFEWVKLRYQTVNNETIETKFTSFAARVIQHELDHLNGILFTDYALGKSPSPHFKLLETKTSQPIYFDDGEKLTIIQDPEKIIVW